MKIRKKDMVLRGDVHTGKWYLGERVDTLADGTQHLKGRVYDVTESVEPAITHTNKYVRRLEDALLEVVKDLYKARGLTCSDRDLEAYFRKLKDRVT